MSDETLPVFAYLDTNVFVEYRPPREVNWRALLAADRVVLVVASVVVAELQLAKDGGKLTRKKRDRVGERIRLIEETLSPIEGPPPRVPISEGVEWVFEPEMPASSVFDEYNLDRRVRDDLLAAFVLARNQRDTACLVAADASARMRVRALGLRAFDMPQSARLAEEPDDVEKKLREVQKQLHAYESKMPRLSICTASRDSVVRYALPISREPTEQEITKQVQNCQQRYPLRTKTAGGAAFVGNGLLGFEAPSEHDISAYNLALERFYRDVRGALPRLLKHHNECDRHIGVSLLLRNEGSAPATDVEVRLSVPPDIEIVAHLPSGPERPTPPEPPRVRGLELYSEHGLDIARLPVRARVPSPRPPEWVIQKNERQSAQIALGKLKQQQGMALPQIFLVIPPRDQPKSFSVNLEIHADNVPAPESARLDVVLSSSEKPRPFELVPRK